MHSFLFFDDNEEAERGPRLRIKSGKISDSRLEHVLDDGFREDRSRPSLVRDGGDAFLEDLFGIDRDLDDTFIDIWR